ncbi:hypothetical protein Nepgr_002534 [Nepenthes gracilis]|uniref:Uncharacterized protein n=1 Tax=Nepenthes gracilis TaxID=150966 RepID=A0AAD3RYH4_NEPGR|nr:hypothetical protein Nepgr_002534 [Nepenthes gracilis]
MRSSGSVRDLAASLAEPERDMTTRSSGKPREDPVARSSGQSRDLGGDELGSGERCSGGAPARAAEDPSADELSGQREIWQRRPYCSNTLKYRGRRADEIGTGGCLGPEVVRPIDPMRMLASSDGLKADRRSPQCYIF